MGNPTLTKVLFAALIVTFMTASLFTAYLQFSQVNNAQIQEPYASIFQNISDKYGDLESVSGTIKDEGLVKNILNLGKNLVTGTVNVFVTGLEAIGTFFEIIPIIGDILAAISLGIPELSGLISLLTLIIGVYFAMRYIQSVTNKTDLP